MIKLAEIAKLAGISTATVSYIVNGKADQYRISKKTQERVLKLIEQHGYRTNAVAAGLRRGCTYTVGLVLPDFENRSYMRIAKRLERLAHKAGYQLIMASTDDDPQHEQRAVERLLDRNIDLLLLASCIPADASSYLLCSKLETPVIGLDRPLPEQQFVSVISNDQAGAGHLLEQLPLAEIERLWVVGALPELPISQRRERGFKEVLQYYPQLEVKHFYASAFAEEAAQQLFLQLLETEQWPEAIVTTSYTLLTGLLSLLRDSELLQQFQNIELATFGISRTLDFLPLKVTALPQQYDRIAEEAWQLAEQALNGQPHKGLVVIPRELHPAGRYGVPASHE